MNNCRRTRSQRKADVISDTERVRNEETKGESSQEDKDARGQRSAGTKHFQQKTEFFAHTPHKARKSFKIRGESWVTDRPLSDPSVGMEM